MSWNVLQPLFALFGEDNLLQELVFVLGLSQLDLHALHFLLNLL